MSSELDVNLVYHRIDPLIYESIVLPEDFGSGHERLELYERTFRAKPKEFYAKNVRRIYTNNSLNRKSSDVELELLQVCDNRTSLECWSDAREALTTILKTKNWPNLKTLCINIDLLPKKEIFHLPLFRHITHLVFFSKEPRLPSWESLKSLSNLTHMCVHMLDRTESHQFRLAVDQAFTIATESRKHFPTGLKHLVIFVPLNLLYRVCNMEHDALDKQRWEHMESLRLGTFDPRIMLGCYGDWEDWSSSGDITEVSCVDKLRSYTDFFMPGLDYLSTPQDHRVKEETDIWAQVILKDSERKEYLALQKK